MSEIRELIFMYFAIGFKQKEILYHLAATHHVHISRRNLQNQMREMGLHRKIYTSNLNEVYNFIADELQKSGSLHGYRWMHWKCKLAGLVVSRQIVEMCMIHLDPEGVKLRKKRRLRRRSYTSAGPNFYWHVDGYDKLKRFGIAISGCIDGFSRLVMWLQAGYSNNDSRIVAGKFYILQYFHR